MKKIILLTLFVSAFYNLFAINTKDKIVRTPTAAIPFECTKMAPWGKPGFELSNSETRNLPMYVYHDLGLKLKTKNQPFARIFRKFTFDNNTFEMLALNIGESDPNKYVLATFNKEGEIIDFIECSVYFITTTRLFVKQWRIDAGQNIIITWLNVNQPEPIKFFDNFDTIIAQRIDSYYKVDTNGKFQLTKQVKYKPQSYTQAYLADKTQNIWDGNEIPLE